MDDNNKERATIDQNTEDRVALGAAGCGWEYSKNIGGFICPQLTKRDGELFCVKYKQQLNKYKDAPLRLEQCGKDAWLDLKKR